jgi:hypothetical protein
MGLINLDDLQVGMVIAQAVRDPHGRVLLAPGCELTDKRLRILRMWGITEVDVAGVEREAVAAQAAAELDPAALARAEAETQQLFLHADLAHDAVRELYRHCTLRLARRLAGGGE